MKTCKKCNEEKDESEYYKVSGNSGGLSGKCKLCTKGDVKKNTEKKLQDPLFVEKERERGREKYHRLNYRGSYKPTPEQKKKQMDTYKNKYPEKRLAHNASQKIKKEVGIELHHWSYNKEHYKDVIELSVSDHNFLHRHIIYDQERMMYRTKELVLLDTKEAHLDYFNSIKPICQV